MLTVFTSTFCRPDLVDFASRAIKATARFPVRFVACVHAGGIEREWSGVDEVVRTDSRGYDAWKNYAADLPWLFMHDDCIPMTRWDESIFPASYCTRNDAGNTLVYCKELTPLLSPAPVIESSRIRAESDAPESWGKVRSLAALCGVESLVSGAFLHLDKSTIAHPDSPANAHKRELIEAIAAHIGIFPPSHLTPEELSVHSGRKDWPAVLSSRQNKRPDFFERAKNFSLAAAQHIAAGAPMASEAEVQRRHDICTACPHFDGKACGKCGCPISRERTWLSKLSWADQSCPVGKWGPASTASTNQP